MLIQFNFVQQCIQISTRINSTSVHTYICVCFIRNVSSIRIYILIDPIFNNVSLFCPHLQSLLAPIYDLTRKGRPFVWTKIHQKNFEEIKKQMVSLPGLTLHTGTGIYILLPDTSKTHAGSAL